MFLGQKTVQRKIAAYSVLLIFLSVASYFISTVWLFSKYESRQLHSLNDYSNSVVDKMLQVEKNKLLRQGELLGQLPVLRAVIDSRDMRTIEETCQSYRKDLSLALFDVLSLKGELLVGDQNFWENANFQEKLTEMKSAGKASDTFYQYSKKSGLILYAITPIGSPIPEAYLLTGTPINQEFVGVIQQMIGTEISIVVDKKMITSSLPQKYQDEVIGLIQIDDTQEQFEGSDHFIHLNFIRDSSGKKIAQFYTHISLQEHRQNRWNLFYVSVFCGIVILLLIASVATFLGKGLSRPIIQLNRTISQILKSQDLSLRTETKSQDEVGLLAQSFNHLLDEIQKKQDELEEANLNLEKRVEERTKSLNESNQKILDQQKTLVNSAKLSALGEMAGGVAHEINNPLAIIKMRTQQMQHKVNSDAYDPASFLKSFEIINRTCDRIAKIITGLRAFSREGQHEEMHFIRLSKIVEETVDLCGEKFISNGVQLINQVEPSLEIYCRSVEVSQIVLNLLNNAYDAVRKLPNPWVKIEAAAIDGNIYLAVTDSGEGIPKEIQDKIMLPFFTTKEVGHGTGLGLSISTGIMKEHGGKFYLDSAHQNTRFVAVFPQKIAA